MTQSVLLIDNYDSFVHNLARYVSEQGYQTIVRRNDAITVEAIAVLRPSHILISPGPGAPQQAGVSLAVIQEWGSRIPILGVCLGHQAIGEAYGATVTRAAFPRHGKSSLITHAGSALFHQLENPLLVGRYHSLIVSDIDFPDTLEVTARCEHGEIMALQHKTHPVFGVQFHPESVLTQQGSALLRNFLLMRLRT